MKKLFLISISITLLGLFSCKQKNQSTSKSDETIYKGYLTLGHEVRSFTGCNAGELAYWVKGNVLNEDFLSNYKALKLPFPYAAVYVELKGSIDTISKRDGFAEQYDGLFEIEEVVKVEALGKENDCNGHLNNIYDKTFQSGAVSFRVVSQIGSISPTVIMLSGFEKDNRSQHKKLDGLIQNVQMADLNNDGFSEIYCFFTSAGSGSYGNVWAVSSNKNKSSSEIHMQELSHRTGYMGHDKFYIKNKQLVREFPLYNDGDNNSNPTAGRRIIAYQLVAGEAGWQLTETYIE